ncbi:MULTISPECIES: tRNA (5-methylaminomethyl-2-thiouridine)(34)-methyltransferase MnmD [unclassified Roseovarius]|uniref:tRNA (5-methylaminomethyl-2-thiouridine)(34)-methyltransferase MnmD n=1 Tax=unclassified Roseovarius TaxID=2614913 RepID=UPI00273D7849|nr:tRNA (5-methylaminomethyl-2-thiouridine)(34)-methyltransferase MnmD [Roseovarius sp. MMSF_3350]
MQDQQAELEWRDGDVPVSTRFDDPYFSLENGLAETRHVFLGGNDLPARFRDGFHVAELGFGTGLNFLTALQAWRAEDVSGTFHFTSFEAFPMAPAQITRALSVFRDLPVEALGLEDGDPFGDTTRGSDYTLRIIIGDARATLPQWDNQADAWFLDGFSPAKNPELWEESLMRQVGQHTAPGGTAATYTAAGFVRRGLQAAGFEVDRVPGYGRKRHMTRARKT